MDVDLLRTSEQVCSYFPVMEVRAASLTRARRSRLRVEELQEAVCEPLSSCMDCIRFCVACSLVGCDIHGARQPFRTSTNAWRNTTELPSCGNEHLHCWDNTEDQKRLWWFIFNSTVLPAWKYKLQQHLWSRSVVCVDGKPWNGSDTVQHSPDVLTPGETLEQNV